MFHQQDKRLTRIYGYSLRGSRAEITRLLTRGVRYTCVVAISLSGVMCTSTVPDTVDGPKFSDFIETQLCNVLQPFNGTNPNSVVVMGAYEGYSFVLVLGDKSWAKRSGMPFVSVRGKIQNLRAVLKSTGRPVNDVYTLITLKLVILVSCRDENMRRHALLKNAVWYLLWAFKKIRPASPESLPREFCQHIFNR